MDDEMCPHEFEIGECDVCEFQAVADLIVSQGPNGPFAGIVPDLARSRVGWGPA